MQSLGNDADLIVAAAPQSTALPGEKEELLVNGSGDINAGNDGEDDAPLKTKAAARKRRLQNVTWAALRLGGARKTADAVGAPVGVGSGSGPAVRLMVGLR